MAYHHDEPDPRRLFQGSELPRMLALAAIMAAGWLIVWQYLRTPQAPAADPAEAVAAGKPPAVEPDRSPEFETVTDKTPLGFRDNAAYELLLQRARDLGPDGMAATARRDVGFTHLWDRPAHYRGVAVHLLGTARRVLRYESKLSRTGWLYEAWVFTPDTLNHPQVCVFEDAPAGLPIGPDVSERVVFNGFFLKLMKYEANDQFRGAPLLVGRIGWTAPGGRVGAGGGPNRLTYAFASAVALMFVVSLFRWIYLLRRSFARKPVAARRHFDRPTEEIAPEALADWLEAVADEDDAPDPDPVPPRRRLPRDSS